MKDFRISKSQVMNLDAGSLLWAVIEPLWPSTDEEDIVGYISKGTKGQRAVCAITLFIREVDNGGLEQFLSNSSGKYIDNVIEGLELIKADEHLDVLKYALKIFPDGKVPIDRSERNKVLNEQLNLRQISSNDYFEKFNTSLYGEEKLQPYFLDYIKGNEADFFKEEV